MVGVMTFRTFDLALGYRTSAGSVAPLVLIFCLLADVFNSRSLEPSACAMTIPQTDRSFGTRIICMAPGSNNDPLQDNDLSLVRWPAWLAAMAFGIVHGIASSVTGVVVNAVTGNISRVSSGFISLLFGKLSNPVQRREKLLVPMMQVGTFVTGIVLGQFIFVIRDHELDYSPEFIICGVPLAYLLFLHDYTYKFEMKERRARRLTRWEGRQEQRVAQKQTHAYPGIAVPSRGPSPSAASPEKRKARAEVCDAV